MAVASQNTKCTITSEVASAQAMADRRGSPTMIARNAKAISAAISTYTGWTDSGRGWSGCGPYSPSLQLQQQCAALLQLGMARMSRAEAIAERTRATGIRTAVDMAGSVPLQAMAEEVRQTTRPQPDLATQVATRAGEAFTGTAPAPKIPPEPVRVDFTNRVNYLEGKRRSHSPAQMIRDAQDQKNLLNRAATWPQACGLFTPGCSGRYDSSVNLTSRLATLISEARRKQSENASTAERTAAQRKQAAETRAIQAASQERIATAQREAATTASGRAAAERRRVAAAQRRDAAKAETDRQRQAQETEMRRRQTQQRQQSSGPTAREFNQAAQSIGSMLNPLANLFSNVAQQRVAAGQAQLASRNQPRQQQYYQQPAKKNNTMLIAAGLGGVGIIFLIILAVALSGGNPTPTPAPAVAAR